MVTAQIRSVSVSMASNLLSPILLPGFVLGLWDSNISYKAYKELSCSNFSYMVSMKPWNKWIYLRWVEGFFLFFCSCFLFLALLPAFPWWCFNPCGDVSVCCLGNLCAVCACCTLPWEQKQTWMLWCHQQRVFENQDSGKWDNRNLCFYRCGTSQSFEGSYTEEFPLVLRHQV